MEPLFHFLFALLLLDIFVTGDLVVACSAVLPDLGYLPFLFVKRDSDLEKKIQHYKIHRLGERMHSIFIPGFLLMLLSFLNTFFIKVALGYIIHISVDIITNNNGVNYFYPFHYQKLDLGLFNWRVHWKLCLLLDLGLFLLILLF